ncbi:hypothetical protein F5879DRAFT_361441 [Lentinula edodes]|uniref:uncharacterized protein n=1 Tax=Lentinula edodes TaxID=5353 RepID=UPI001E8CF179|nr:uncharacterized protein C8R40DRAFT_75053 [Lentinula edodes]KAH7877422.1 hypothetical protein C8R40DRAFT_75053 [Lentinula edodes]KAJ3901060.1 hypothetical protein F5879DRAFT_361441 [Lentinula edodes]
MGLSFLSLFFPRRLFVVALFVCVACEYQFQLHQVVNRSHIYGVRMLYFLDRIYQNRTLAYSPRVVIPPILHNMPMPVSKLDTLAYTSLIPSGNQRVVQGLLWVTTRFKQYLKSQRKSICVPLWPLRLTKSSR